MNSNAMDGKVKVPRKLLVCLLGGDEPRRSGLQRASRSKREGSAIVSARASSAVADERKTNADVYLTGAAPEICVATRDLFDRAHSQRGHDGKIVAAATGGVRGRPVKSNVMSAKPRRYPVSQLTSRGVAFDSAYDETYERQQALSGVASGVGGRVMTMAEARYVALARMGSERSVRALARWEGRGNAEEE